MRPKFSVLVASFVAFYLLIDLNQQIGRYLAEHRFYAQLGTVQGRLLLARPLVVFSLCNVISYGLFFSVYYRYRRPVATVALYLLAAVPLMIACRYLIEEVIVYHIWGVHNYGVLRRQLVHYSLDNVYYVVQYSLFGIVFFFVQYSGFHQRRQQELLLQNRQAELSYLRSQINPHFLFNSLNNIYALVYRQSPHALASIESLAELLRYTLYEKGELVALEKEVLYLHHYIALQRMRYSAAPSLLVDIPPFPPALQIAPLTLIPFVENAFKHGDLRDSGFPLAIRLAVVEDAMTFEVHNKKSTLNKDRAGGIGLENTKRRLDLLYGPRHRLDIVNTAERFSITLRLNLFA